ncbi:MAG: FAD-dependent oxidoreductase, partial [Solobacterium sp.]|nr:FAD-dependent oxidoreductase [Solobacterium sp.]
ETIAVIGGGVTGLETAETLAKDHKVTVIEILNKVGGNLYPSIVMHLVQEIRKHGGAIEKGKGLLSIEDGKITVKDMATEETEEIPADQVVLALGVRPNRPDYDALKREFGDKLILAGDAAKGGQIFDALHAGYDRAFVFEL